MSLPLITVVIPAYNVEKYIDRCLDSFVRQSYKNLEIIVINDGSTDRTEESIQSFVERDSRVFKISQKNQGLSAARNAGIEAAKGQYITFVDSDDFVSENYIEHLFEIMIKEQAEVSVCGHQKFYKEQDIQSRDSSQESESLLEAMTGVEALRNLLYRKKIVTSAWGKLYKAELLSGIRYPVGWIYEDLATTYKILGRAKKVVISNEENYYYFQRADSIFHTKFQQKNIVQLEISEEMLKYVKHYYPQCEKAAYSRHFISCVQLYRMISKEEQFQKIFIKVKEEIKKYRSSVLFDKNAKTSTRIMAMIACVNISALRLMGKVYTKGIRIFKIRLKY